SVSSFFFQAEDGIRDFHVTGVQTCALPISRTQPCQEATDAQSGHGRSGTRNPCLLHAVFPVGVRSCRIVSSLPESPIAPTPGLRSEERRVGKERGCRWEAYDCN